MNQYEPDYIISNINDDDEKTKHNINDTVTEIVKETIKKIRKKRIVLKKPAKQKKKNKAQGIITKPDGTFKIIIFT